MCINFEIAPKWPRSKSNSRRKDSFEGVGVSVVPFAGPSMLKICIFIAPKPLHTMNE